MYYENNTGTKTVIGQCVRMEERKTLNEFIKAIKSTFDNVNTEHKLDSELEKADLMVPVEECLLSADELMEVDGTVEDACLILTPLNFKIKKFFELPNVFQKIQDNTIKMQQKQNISHFINGSLWKEKLKSYREDETVIPYNFYMDASQLNHPLGPHCHEGQESLTYLTFPTIPREYQSRLENIFLASLCPDYCLKNFGAEKVFGNIIEELIKLARDGIVLNINGDGIKVFFVCGVFIGDNKEANTVLGFVMSFIANFYCRYCKMKREDMHFATIEDAEMRRNRENYCEDVITNNQSLTGVRAYSIFNEIPLFHVVESSAEDLFHNLLEGELHYNLAEIILYFIDEGFFTLNELNRRIQSFSYSEDEKGNIPIPILMKRLEKHKFKMTGAEMFNFAHNITFIIGDLVPEDNVVWAFLLNTQKLFDLCYLPSYEEEDFDELRKIIEQVNFQYPNLFDTHNKPVHHFSIHYPEDIKKFGPLRYLNTMRCEGKHRELKSYTNNTNNRVNVSLSIAKKEQYNFAERLFQSRGLYDIIKVANYETGLIKEKVYYPTLQSCINKENISLQECFFTHQVEVNGIIFTTDLWLPEFINNESKKIHEICDLVLTQLNEIKSIFAVCKTYNTITSNEHYNSYCIEMNSLQSELSVINIKDYLENQHYPVKIHNINNEFMFRCKRF